MISHYQSRLALLVLLLLQQVPPVLLLLLLQREKQVRERTVLALEHQAGVTAR
jgi:hypothetical protein